MYCKSKQINTLQRDHCTWTCLCLHTSSLSEINKTRVKPWWGWSHTACPGHEGGETVGRPILKGRHTQSLLTPWRACSVEESLAVLPMLPEATKVDSVVKESLMATKRSGHFHNLWCSITLTIWLQKGGDAPIFLTITTLITTLHFHNLIPLFASLPFWG